MSVEPSPAIAAEPPAFARGNDARRLVLGAAVGLTVEQVRIFVESLRGVGYRGDVVMFIGLRDFALAAYLRRHRVTPLRAALVRRFHGPIHARRYTLFARYLNAGAQRYDEVLISDVRDVAFQAHPFAAAGGPTCQFFLEGDCRNIGDEPTNMIYMQAFLPADDVERLKPRRISCCGVVLGGTAAMRTYLDAMVARLARVPLRVRRKIGADTAFHNQIAYLTREVDGAVVENNVHVATMSIEPTARYVVGPDLAIRTADGGLPAILHQYDRIPEFLRAVAARWR